MVKRTLQPHRAAWGHAFHGVVDVGAGAYSQIEFKTYQYVLTPTEQQLWYDADGDGFGPEDLLGVQSLVSASGYDSLGYRIDFPTIEGVRLYWRASDGRAQAEIDWLTIDVVPEPGTWAMLLSAAVACLVVLLRGFGRRRLRSVEVRGSIPSRSIAR